MRERAVHGSLLVVAVLAAVWLVVRAERRVVPSKDRVLEAVPPGATLIVRLDAGRLLREARSEILELGGGALLGLRSTCGFEPALSIERAVLCTPDAGPSLAGDFALIAETSRSAAELVDCAEKVLRQRGGEPVRSRIGRFATVRDRRRPLGEIGARDDGLLVLSGGQYFRDVLDRANGAVEAPERAKLRDRLHGELSRELGPAPLFASYVPGDGAAPEGVAAAAVAATLGAEVTLRGLVACRSAEACDGLREALGAAPGLNVSRRELRLEVRGSWPRRELVPLLRELAGG